MRPTSRAQPAPSLPARERPPAHTQALGARNVTHRRPILRGSRAGRPPEERGASALHARARRCRGDERAESIEDSSRRRELSPP
eukprot:7389032-Prymnesium_polylepis.1